MGKNDLKRAAAKHSQNLKEMFKRQRLATANSNETTYVSPNENDIAKSSNRSEESEESSISASPLFEDNPTTEKLQASKETAIPSSTNSKSERPSTSASSSSEPEVSVLSSDPGKQSKESSKPTAIQEPFQPRDPKFTFPLRSFSNGKKQKRFNRDWFENKDWKSWLHYDSEKDAAFCATCVNATRMNFISSKNADKAFISNGFTNWPDAGTKNRGFDKHF